ncbi:MAG: beta-ketoacyl-[acyl-carrier-protein] synthase family protein [Bacteriovoracaceae bacterium]|nr:beta-ketoacyl-[acyl-carrier-protein] synthase family protein [Bacteriovoracaceae bacterium]
MERRVVVTGMGVISPNGTGIPEFTKSLKEGLSGVTHHPLMEEYNCRCQVGGKPKITDEYIASKIPSSHTKRMSETMIYALLAALECAEDASLEVAPFGEIPNDRPPLWDVGCMVGATNNGADILITETGPKILSGNTKRLGVSIIEKTMTSGVSAKIAGILGLGNKVTSNGSACCTGAEAILDAYYHIKSGRARAMFCGASEGGAPYQWCGFDAMRIINSKFNDTPEKASRPFSASSTSFIPGCGAAVLYIEEYQSAVNRGAKIYAEILGGVSNCGGQRLGGTMTAPNSEGVKRCIKESIELAGINPAQLDYINGHLTGTFGDPIEIKNWSEALDLGPEEFPYINSTKSLIGHGLSAAGAIESVATILQMEHSFIHPSLNTEDLYEELIPYRHAIPEALVEKKITYAAKASFGFGDVNCVLIFKNEN